MWKMPESCPTCGASLEVRELACPQCTTEIRGHFHPCDFCRLTEDQTTFLRVFILSRGNLKGVGEELGISYPTVSGKLEEVIRALRGDTGKSTKTPDSSARREVLDRIANGDLSVTEGLRLLKEIKAPEREPA